MSSIPENVPAESSPVYLSMAVVLYRNDVAQLSRLRDALLTAVQTLRDQLPVAKVSLAVIDNTAADVDGHIYSAAAARVFNRLPGIDSQRFIRAETNLGYGVGHNRCIDGGSDFHLVLNPDVYLAPDALVAGIRYLQDHPAVGLVSPHGENDAGQPLYLCKRYPTVLDFVLRGFAPTWLRRLFDVRLARYEMRAEAQAQQPCEQVEIASGCCMLVRTPLLRKLGGFDPAYFLYFEDFDLSMRLREHARIAFVPQMCIVHDGGHAARKGWQHIRLFAESGKRFFSRWGWRWWSV